VWIVVGLGNPGPRYRGTRHNVGFRVVDLLAARWHAAIARRAHRALVGEARWNGNRVLLVKPETYMNASGEAVRSLWRYYENALERLVVIHDDADLALGRVRLRAGGGAGGHRGVASLIDALGDPGFLRVKVGVGRPPPGCETAAYVLAEPRDDEAGVLRDAERGAADAMELLLTEGAARAMNRVNQREAPHGGSPL